VSAAIKSVTPRVEERLCDPVTGVALTFDGKAYVGADRHYPIINGIPRFVDSDRYARSFSFEWNTHDRTQLDIYRDDRPSEREFVAKTGFTPEFLSGKLVLDAGVGAGRYADIASRWGADVVGVDLSYAVEAAQRNLGERSNVWIAQADIGALPFCPTSFDVIFSIGVLHHTPDTRAYFHKLVPLLKPGGVIAIWVYSRSDDYAIRARWVPFVNKLPDNVFYAWCRWFVPWAQARLTYPLVGALRRTFPFPTHGLGIEYDILDTFDGYSPAFHGIHSPEEVEGWFQEAGLVDIEQPSEWITCMRGRRPR
jgi:SAM-dependent methyltransferase